MKAKLQYICIVLALLVGIHQAAAQGTAFMYQGRLVSGGVPANGSYDIQFTLFSINTGGVAIAVPVTNSATAVSNGLFIATIDFGGVFTGTNYWLELAVQTNGGSGFTTLSPRQPISPTPYSIYSANAGSAATATTANSVEAAGITGTILPAQLPAALVTNTETGVTLSGTFSGNGGGLTNLNVTTAQLNGSANQNVFVGSGGYPPATGSADTSLGYEALANNTSGSANTANGDSALFSNGTGNENTAIGLNALYSNVVGNENTAIGYQALGDLGVPFVGGPGTNNIALGYKAGVNIFSGSYNIEIGNPGANYDNETIRIGSSQTQTYIAGLINGNGGGLTNLYAAQVTGSFTNGFAINGSQSGGIGTPLALIQNNNTSGNTAPALRVVGSGNSPNGVLSVSSAGTGLLAQFGNAFAFVADITTNGTVDAAGFNGGTLRVGASGTTMSVIQSGQAQMPGGSSTVETNFTITFPQAFSSTPKILVSVANDPGFQGVNDTFVTSVSSNSASAFRVNIVRVDSVGGWSQHLLVNWQAWQ